MTSADHVMADLETFDVVPAATVISIGAVVFAGPHAGLTFYTAVDATSGICAGLTVCPGTVAWWGRQSAEARAVLDDPHRVPLHDALLRFAEFLRPLHDPRVWGNGASFDNAILATAYRAVREPLPWKHWNDRCYRTVAASIPAKRQQQGTHHNALDDAISQAGHLLAYAPESIV